eukprot:14589923-Ditylum_brightwellii.AAC.1
MQSDKHQPSKDYDGQSEGRMQSDKHCPPEDQYRQSDERIQYSLTSTGPQKTSMDDQMRRCRAQSKVDKTVMKIFSML